PRGGAVGGLPLSARAGPPVGRDHAAGVAPLLHGPDGRPDRRAGPGPDRGQRGPRRADPGRRPVRRAVRAAGPGVPVTRRSRGPALGWAAWAGRRSSADPPTLAEDHWPERPVVPATG